MIVAVSLAGLTLTRWWSGRAPETAASERHAQDHNHDRSLQSRLRAASAARGREAPPRLQAQSLDPGLTRLGARSLADELDPGRLREAEAVDWAARRKAFASVELTPDEVARAEVVYRESDRMWLEAERLLDRRTGLLLPEGIEKLHASDRHVMLGLMKIVGAARAGRVRTAERMAYRERIRGEYSGDAQASFATRLSVRRLDVQRRILDLAVRE